jgi:Holliday junction DNA helicase RuvA
MIGRITGRLERMVEGAAWIDTSAGLTYEVLVPAADVERLSRRVGQDISLFTIHYLEGDPSHGSQTPRLVGFLSEEDRKFFRLFTTVKGIGNRKALRALALPIAQIASAIAGKDAKFLVALPEIGRRTAEQIIAELNGKVDEFAGPIRPDQAPLNPAAAEALSVLVQLGERRNDAQALIERVLAVAPELTSPEAIIQHVYRLKAGGA